MEYLPSLVIIAIAALIHASFQLSVSVLTLLSGHAIGSNKSHMRLLGLTNSFALGVGTMTVLLVSTAALFTQNLTNGAVPALAWVSLCGLMFGLGVAVWLFYYRKESGTSLWVPRGAARYLHDRTKATKSSMESFSLGVISVLGEILFIAAPVLAAVFVLVSLPPLWQLLGVVLYAAVSLSSMLIVNGLIGSGHKLSKIQKWRESNKQFLQFAAGTGLFILGFYLYVFEVLSPAVLAAGGVQ